VHSLSDFAVILMFYFLEAAPLPVIYKLSQRDSRVHSMEGKHQYIPNPGATIV
jgi:hypothetical protein